jgi:hypothetical protein
VAKELAKSLQDALIDFLRPLQDAAANPAAMSDWLATLGQTASISGDAALLQIAQHADVLAARLSNFDPQALTTWTGLRDLIGASSGVAAIEDELRQFAANPARAAIAGDLAREVTALMLASYLRRRHPRLFRAGALLQMVDVRETAPLDPPVVQNEVTVRYGRVLDQFRFSSTSKLLSDPAELFHDVYFPNELLIGADAWAAAANLFPLLGMLADELGLPSRSAHPPVVPVPDPPDDDIPVDPATLKAPPGTGDEEPPPDPPPPPDSYFAAYYPTFRVASVEANGAEAAIELLVSSAAHAGGVAGYLLTPVGTFNRNLTSGEWHLQLSANGQIPAFVIRSSGFALAPGNSPAANGFVKILLEHLPAEGSSGPAFVFGSATGSRLELGTLQLRAALLFDTGREAATFSLAASKCSLILSAGDGDGFLQAALPSDGLRSDFDLGLEWSSDRGFAFRGAAGLDVSLPIGLSVGGVVTIPSVHLALLAAADGLTAEVSASIGVTIGPFSTVIDRIGIEAAARFPDSGGNFGPADLALDFKPPSGIGLAVDAAGVTGGGFVGRDPASGRYSGVLDLHLQKIGITALGLLDTKLPAGQGGYALLLALRATFPAVQIGFGFALTGVGGLLALNRRVDVDALRGQLAAGTAGRILAPQDPVRNAPALLADLDAVFPIAAGITVVGPTVQLLWAGLVHLDVGVFIELPGPARVVLLGSAHAEIERDGRAYLSIRVDIVGVVDLRAETAAFDAVLIDSHLMGMLDLTGGAAFRLSWGAQPYAVLSLGGFNPAYDPEPLSFPATLTRIAMVHGTPSDELYLRFEGYFAITSNTLQFGASVEALIQSDHFVVHGTVGFDALIQRSPFHFQFDIRASVTVAYRGQTLAGLTLTGSLTGPGPVVLQAKVCIELLFFDICFSGTFPLGPAIAPLLAAAAGLLDTLLGELDNPATLRAAGAPDPYVRLQPPDPSLTTAVVAPSGTVVWEQQSAPLDLLLTRVGGAPLPAPAQVSAASAAPSAAQSDWFAPGQFIDLTDDQALTRPAYERLTGGLQLAGAGVADGPGAQATLTTTQIRLPAKATTPGKPVIVFPAWILTSAAGPATPAIAVRTESWIVTTPAGDHHDLTGAQARQLAALTTSARAIPAADRLAAFTF